MKGRRNRLVFGIAIGLLSVAVLLFVLVLVVPDRMLKSNYIRSQIGGDPESGILDYDSASSKWPGTIHVKNLRFRDRDPKAEARVARNLVIAFDARDFFDVVHFDLEIAAAHRRRDGQLGVRTANFRAESGQDLAHARCRDRHAQNLTDPGRPNLGDRPNGPSRSPAPERCC